MADKGNYPGLYQRRSQQPLSREEELKMRFCSMKEGMELIPGLDPLQFLILERLAHQSIHIADYEEKMLAKKPFDERMYNQAMGTFDRMSRTLFEGTAKALNKAALERIFIERVIGVVAEIAPPDVAKKIAEELSNL